MKYGEVVQFDPIESWIAVELPRVRGALLRCLFSFACTSSITISANSTPPAEPAYGGRRLVRDFIPKFCEWNLL